jgi:2-oxoisovalerate dehydrogenase E1 component alpha subunit
MNNTVLPSFTQEPIRLLEVDGRKHGDWKLELSVAQLHGLYRDMLRGRMLDEKLRLWQKQGKSHFFMGMSGQEAVQVGAAHAIRAGQDWVYPYYRDTALVLALGVPMLEMVAQNFGLNADPNKARQMPHHPGSKERRVVSVCSSIASQVPVAAGIAIAQRFTQSQDVTLVCFGEGATSEGDWHAGMNIGAVFKAPIVYLCQNNRYVITQDFSSQTTSKNVAVKAHAYGIPGYLVDGQDVLAVHAVIQKAVEHARAGLGPSLIEAQTYRYDPHSSSDDDARYRSREEVASWRNLDPISRFQAFLEHQGLWSDDLETSIRAETTAELEHALKQAETSGTPEPSSLFDDVYASLTPELERQKLRLLKQSQLAGEY